MAILSEVKAQNNSMYVLSGDVNKACLHAQPMEHSEGKPTEMRFSITCRAACRLRVNTRLGKYQQFSGKRWETRDLPRAQSLEESEETTSNTAIVNQKMCIRRCREPRRAKPILSKHCPQAKRNTVNHSLSV